MTEESFTDAWAKSNSGATSGPGENPAETAFSELGSSTQKHRDHCGEFTP